MRHVAAAVLRQLSFPGKDVAAVIGLSRVYVATLHQRALREGTSGAGPRAGTARQTGRARRGTRRRRWRAAGARDSGDRAAGRGSPSPPCCGGWARRARAADPLPEPEVSRSRRPAGGTGTGRRAQAGHGDQGPDAARARAGRGTGGPAPEPQAAPRRQSPHPASCRPGGRAGSGRRAPVLARPGMRGRCWPTPSWTRIGAEAILRAALPPAGPAPAGRPGAADRGTRWRSRWAPPPPRSPST